MEESIIEAAKSYIRDVFQSDHGGHDTEHTMRVYRNAMSIADNEPDCDRGIVAISALLHDVDDHKLFDSKNNDNARAFLGGQGVSSSETEKICAVINDVSFSKNRGKRPGSLEAMIVQDADRLDAMGAIGIARTFAYGGEHGRAISESVRHFYDKLLLLKDEMNTETAVKIAEGRHAFLKGFLKELEEENINIHSDHGSDPIRL